MKIALIGDGKTGQYLKELIPKEDLIGPFNLTYKIEDHLNEFEKADVAISFVPGASVAELIPTLLKTKVPVIWGSTGMQWPKNLDQDLKEKSLSWVFASNFSLGILTMKNLMETLSKRIPLFREFNLSIHEIHHTQKKDAPSGTALSLEKWLGQDKVTVTSERIGDVVGIHEVTLETSTEKIVIRHEAKTRAIFAEGAFKMAQMIAKGEVQEKGLLSFHELLD